MDDGVEAWVCMLIEMLSLLIKGQYERRKKEETEQTLKRVVLLEGLIQEKWYNK